MSKPKPIDHLSTLTPADYNPRQSWTPQQATAFSKSLATFGDLGGIIKNRTTGNLVGGHKRVDEFRRAAQFNIEKTPCKPDNQGTVAYGYAIADGNRFAYREVEWSIEKEQQANIAANQWQAEWDKKALADLIKDLDSDTRTLIGLSPSDIDGLNSIAEVAAPNQERPEHNRAAELNQQWKVKPGDLWRIGNHRLLCGDSTNSKDVARCFDGAKPWLMVTDPPYGVDYDPDWRNEAGLANTKTTGKVTNDTRAKWAATYTRSGCEVAYIWHSAVHAHEVTSDLISSNFTIRSQIVWIKKRFAISRGDYHWQHEPAIYAVKQGCSGRFTGNRKNSTLWADITDCFTPKTELFATRLDEKTIYAFPASCTTVWSLPNDKQCDGGHSTQKPVECMARPIRNHGMEGDYVYDPFSGTGTTGIAAEQLSRRARLIEVSADYCAVVLERFKTTYPKLEIVRA